MGAPRKTSDPDAWMLRRPLQVEELRQSLPSLDGLDARLRELQRYRENVDAVVFALSNRELAGDRRHHLLELLERHQEALDRCLAALGMPARVQSPAPLWYFSRLDPTARHHLTSILGVSEEPDYHEVLEVKAEEYLAQRSAFETLGERLEFQDTRILPRDANLPALALTLSGSLIQLSAPLSVRGERRYLYQNIYGNTHPPEGLLRLDHDVRTGHRLRSVELTTSPVRLLRVMGAGSSWRAQAQSFDRMARTLGSLVSRSSAQLAEADPHHLYTGVHRRLNLDAAERVFREDNREALARFEALRERFLDRDAVSAHEVEAELLTVCHRLQLAAQELGFEARGLDDLTGFDTEGGRAYRLDPQHPGRLQVQGGVEVVLSGVSVGRQQVTLMAPLALVGGDGCLVEVTRPVAKLLR